MWWLEISKLHDLWLYLSWCLGSLISADYEDGRFPYFKQSEICTGDQVEFYGPQMARRYSIAKKTLGTNADPSFTFSSKNTFKASPWEAPLKHWPPC